MNTVDIILAICLFPAIVQGISKGFVSQAIALISVILGVWASFHFAEAVCGFISPYLDIAEPVIHVIAFILIFCAVAYGLHLVEKLLTGIIKMVMLGWLNKLLGVAFALFKAMLLIGVVVMLFNTINVDGKFISQEVLDQSVLYGPVKNFAYTVFPYFKALLFKQ